MTLDESLRALQQKWRLSSNATSNDRWDDGYQVACEDHADELAALLSTRQEVAPVADGAALLVRDVCEMAPADPDAPDTVCIRVADLTRIAELYTSTGQTSDARRTSMDDSIGILRQMLAGHEKHAALAEATGSREVEYHRNRCRALRAAIAALDAAPVMYVTHDGKHGEYSTGKTSDAMDVDVICVGHDSVLAHTHPEWLDTGRLCMGSGTPEWPHNCSCPKHASNECVTVSRDTLENCVADACAYINSDRGWDEYGTHRDSVADSYKAMLSAPAGSGEVETLQKLRDAITQEPEDRFGYSQVDHGSGIPRAYSVRENLLCIIDNALLRKLQQGADGELDALRLIRDQWLEENGPGGWIDELRNAVDRANALADRWDHIYGRFADELRVALEGGNADH